MSSGTKQVTYGHGHCGSISCQNGTHNNVCEHIFQFGSGDFY